MNKLILILIILFILALFGCTQSTPVCGDMVCGIDELSSDSSYYCPSDCGIEEEKGPSQELTLPDSSDANFYTDKTVYQVGEKINIE